MNVYPQKQPPKGVLQKRCSDLPGRTSITASCQLSSEQVDFTRKTNIYVRTGTNLHTNIFSQEDVPFPEQLKNCQEGEPSSEQVRFSQEAKHAIFSRQVKLTGRWYNFRTGQFFPGRWNNIRKDDFPGRWNNIRTGNFSQEDGITSEQVSISQEGEIISEQPIFHRSKSRSEQVNFPRRNIPSEHLFYGTPPSGCFRTLLHFPSLCPWSTIKVFEGYSVANLCINGLPFIGNICTGGHTGSSFQTIIL